MGEFLAKTTADHKSSTKGHLTFPQTPQEFKKILCGRDKSGTFWKVQVPLHLA